MCSCLWLLLLFVWLPASFPSTLNSDARDYTVTISTVSEYKGEFVETVQYTAGQQVFVNVLMGRLVEYRKDASERIEKLGNGMAARMTGFMLLTPTKSLVDTIDLSYWYEPLEAGRYQLSLQRIFFKQRIDSNAVLFDVIR
jgi:hypothetical protein